MKKLLTLCAVGLVAMAATARAAHADVDVYVGYADGLRAGGFFPDPWQSDPNVQFYGASPGKNYDAGAFMFVNTGATKVTLGPGLNVDHFANGADFQLWDSLIGSGIVIAPGQRAIFTQTDDNNFDTSDQPIQGLPANTAQPEIHVTLDGSLDTFTDSKQVLDTFGFDPGTFPTDSFGPNESIGWRLIGTAGIEDLTNSVDKTFKVDNADVTPEPGSLALLAVGGLPLFGFLRRRRAA